LNTDVSDDLIRSLNDGMDSRLPEELVKAKGVRVVTNVTCLMVSPVVETLPEVCKPLLLGFLWHTDGLGVCVVTIVFVQGFRDEVEILCLESPTPFVHEFDFRGIGAR